MSTSVLNKTFDEFLIELYKNPALLNIIAPNSIKTTTGVTEQDEKYYIEALLRSLKMYANIADIPYTERIDVTLCPNEYCNIFSLNRCFSRLYENDMHIFNNIDSFGVLLNWDPSITFNKNDRVIYYNPICNKANSNYRIYVCLKDKVKNIAPNKDNSIPYNYAIHISEDKLSDNIVWAEDFPSLDSFNTTAGQLTWNEYNIKPFTELNAFSFEDKSRFTINETLEYANIHKLMDNSKSYDWPKNTPVVYNNMSVSSLVPNNTGVLIYKNANENISKTYSISADDYIISSVISSYVNQYDSGTVWVKYYKSGWVEQGGRHNFIINNETSSNITYAKDTYLIGTSGKSNILIKVNIPTVVEYDELLSYNYSLNELSTSVDNTKVRVYNKQIIFDETNLTYKNPSAFIAGLVLSSTGIGDTYKEAPDDYSTDAVQISSCINWQSNGIKFF